MKNTPLELILLVFLDFLSLSYMFKNTLKSSEIKRSRFLEYNKIYYYQLYKYDKLKFSLIRLKKRNKKEN